MISRLGTVISRLFARIVPDPFVLAILLTLLTIGLALGLTTTDWRALVSVWAGNRGVWSLLEFAMQMCLILVTGHAVASSPPVARISRRLAALPRTGPQAVALVAVMACSAALLNWGLGLIVGAIGARMVGAAMRSRGVRVHYPLLAAAGYLGMLVWHGGLSGSAPLKVTTEPDLVEIFGPNPPIDPVSLDRTLFSPLNLFVTLGLLVLAPLVAVRLFPRDPAALRTPEEFGVVDPPEPPPPPRREPVRGLPRLLEETPLMTVALAGLIALWAWGYYFPSGGLTGALSLTPNTVNLTMLLIGLVLHRTPAAYLRAVDQAVRGCAGIILQFPLYAGIMGMMTVSGLTLLLATGLAETASPTLLPLLTFLSASLVNLFVPSGGGQWAVQGPVAVTAGLAAGVDPSTMVLAVAYGDQLTNMLQPFWALPLLAITGVRARDLVGYTAIIMVVGGLWIGLGLLLWG